METEIGKISHFFNKVSVAVLALTGSLSVGDRIHFVGKRTDFSQTVESLQVNHENLVTVSGGMEVGLKVEQAVREGDIVYRVNN